MRHANAIKDLLIESLQASSVRLKVSLKKADLSSAVEVVGIGGKIRSGRVGAFEIQVIHL